MDKDPTRVLSSLETSELLFTRPNNEVTRLVTATWSLEQARGSIFLTILTLRHSSTLNVANESSLLLRRVLSRLRGWLQVAVCLIPFQELLDRCLGQLLKKQRMYWHSERIDMSLR